MFNFKLVFRLFVVAMVLFTVASAQDKNSKEPGVITLVQTPGKFETDALQLKAGKYQFEIINKNIDTEVAFFLRDEADKESMDLSTALPNSLLEKTLKKGERGMTGIIELEPGKYVYGCPLNGTPLYTITVE